MQNVEPWPTGSPYSFWLSVKFDTTELIFEPKYLYYERQRLILKLIDTNFYFHKKKILPLRICIKLIYFLQIYLYMSMKDLHNPVYYNEIGHLYTHSSFAPLHKYSFLTINTNTWCFKNNTFYFCKTIYNFWCTNNFLISFLFNTVFFKLIILIFNLLYIIFY